MFTPNKFKMTELADKHKFIEEYGFGVVISCADDLSATHLPFILKKVGHMGNPIEQEYGTRFPEHVVNVLKRVELDMYKTRIELFKERFIDTFNDWCHRNNVQSRMQAYGRGMHPLEASMEIDIPECETWLFKDIGREYPNTGLKGRGPRMCNKYVSSGAVLAGKKIVSCEEITNTEMAFMATLENIKVAGDQSNISGVNHSTRSRIPWMDTLWSLF